MGRRRGPVRDVLAIGLFLLMVFTIGPPLCLFFGQLADDITVGQPAFNQFVAHFLLEAVGSSFIVGVSLSVAGRKETLPAGAIGAAILALVGVILC
jgi:hypothetical protein